MLSAVDVLKKRFKALIKEVRASNLSADEVRPYFEHSKGAVLDQLSAYFPDPEAIKQFDRVNATTLDLVLDTGATPAADPELTPRKPATPSLTPAPTTFPDAPPRDLTPPPRQPTPTLPTSQTSLLTAPTTTFSGAMDQAPPDDVLYSFEYIPESNSVASTEQIRQLSVAFEALGVPKAKLMEAAFDIANYCCDVGSSASTELTGSCPGIPVKRTFLAASIKEVCTLRQFCMYYAKLVWNFRLHTKRPPANYSRMGYTEAVKYAAFDFFDGVTHPAALRPTSGLIRQPSSAETIANQTNRRISIYRTAQTHSNTVSNYVEMTRGKLSDGPGMQLLPGPE